MSLRDDILDLARRNSGQSASSRISPDEDFLGSFGLEGDDANEFLEAFAKKYSVDFEGFRWYFHYIADEPPHYRRVVPIAPSGEVIPLQPIRLDQLIAAAENGAWEINYPDHEVRQRPSWRILAFVVGLFLVCAIFAYLTV